MADFKKPRHHSPAENSFKHRSGAWQCSYSFYRKAEGKFGWLVPFAVLGTAVSNYDGKQPVTYLRIHPNPILQSPQKSSQLANSAFHNGLVWRKRQIGDKGVDYAAFGGCLSGHERFEAKRSNQA